jgi:hypothetical protein
MRFQGVNASVVFINGLTSIMKQANYSSDVVRDWHAVDSLASALKLATTCTGARKAVPAEELPTCGKLLLQRNGSRASWDGADAGLAIGEYRIIDLLASKPGQHFTCRAIYDRLRHEGFVAGDGQEVTGLMYDRRSSASASSSGASMTPLMRSRTILVLAIAGANRTKRAQNGRRPGVDVWDRAFLIARALGKHAEAYKIYPSQGDPALRFTHIQMAFSMRCHRLQAPRVRRVAL